MKLVDYLKQKFGVSDDELVLAYIKAGHVKLDGASVTNPNFELKGREVELENVELLKKGKEYWSMREVIELTSISEMNRVLGFELKQGHVDALLERRADLVVLNFQDYGLENYVQCHIGNLFYEDFVPVLKGKFDVMVSFVKSNPVRIFGIIERYLPVMMEDFRVVVVADSGSFDSIREMKEAYSSAASLLLLELKKVKLLPFDELVAMLFERKKVVL